MQNAIYCDPQKRHDFVLLFDVQDGNPNGDPDAGNLPRVDPENMHGLVTDVCIKRKVRNYVDLTHGNDEHTKIYVQDKGIALNTLHERAYTAKGEKPTDKPSRELMMNVRSWMCENFYDIRMFGAVMTTGVNCGQVRGPVQITFARSIDPVVPLDFSITRVAITRPSEAEVVQADDGSETGGKRTEMGRKPIVPYGLYRAYGFFSPYLAADTGVKSNDLALFWEALQKMWEYDRSASRGMMACRGLYIFTHDHPLGNAHAHELFERISVRRVGGNGSPRAFSDYRVEANSSSLPEGVTLTTF